MKIKELLINYKDVELTKEQEKQIKEYLGIKESKKWKPEKGEKYWCVDSGLSVLNPFFANDNLDNTYLFTNNFFKTEEDALFRLEQIKVYNELKNFADENNEEIDWEDNSIKKWFIMYDYSNLGIIFNYYLQHIGNIYFSSRGLAQQAIEKVGADRIKKYLFGVWDNE